MTFTQKGLKMLGPFCGIAYNLKHYLSRSNQKVIKCIVLIN